MTNSELLDALAKLLPAQFDDLLYRVHAPIQYFAGPQAAPTSRIVDFLHWADQQERRTEVEKLWRERFAPAGAAPAGDAPRGSTTSESDLVARAPDVRLADDRAPRLEKQPAAAPRRAGRRARRPAVSTASTDDLLAQITSRDPLLCIPAANELIKHPGLLPHIIDAASYYDNSPVSGHAVGIVVGAHPRESGEVLMGHLMTAKEDWPDTQTKISHFAPVHRARHADTIMSLLQRSDDTKEIRSYIEALGWMGAHELDFPVKRFLEQQDDYGFDKYNDYVALALARMFVLARGETAIRSSSLALRQAMAFIVERRRSGPQSSHNEILEQCSPSHADDLIREWLGDPVENTRRNAITALGRLRFSRASDALSTILESPTEPEHMIRAATIALGNIGTGSAQEALLRYGPHSERGLGIGLCLDRISDPATFRQLVEAMVSSDHFFRWSACRAIGQRKEPGFEEELRAALYARANELTRGSAALAIARFGRQGDVEVLEAAHAEATNELERVLTALALFTLVPSSFDRLEAQFRADLGHQSFNYWEPLQSDIIQTCMSLENPRATALAKAWSPFYHRRAR